MRGIGFLNLLETQDGASLPELEQLIENMDEEIRPILEREGGRILLQLQKDAGF